MHATEATSAAVALDLIVAGVLPMPGASVCYRRMNAPMAQGVRAGWVCIAFLAAGCGTTSENAVDKVRVSPELLHGWLSRNPKKYLVVDARPASSYESGHIPGAVRIEPQDVSPTDPDPRFATYRAVVVYGEDPSFGRANAMTKRLLESGAPVRMLDGGLKAWRDRGYPIEAPP